MKMRLFEKTMVLLLAAGLGLCASPAMAEEAVTEAVIGELTPIQEKYNEIIADKDGLNAILKRNAERAHYLAQKTMRKVYKKVGLYQG